MKFSLSLVDTDLLYGRLCTEFSAIRVVYQLLMGYGGRLRSCWLVPVRPKRLYYRSIY
jgi:hypothetical protein